MRTIEETATAILAPPKGMLVADEYAEALVPSTAELALRETALTDHISALLLTAETFAATLPLRRQLSESPAEPPLVGVRMAPTGTGVETGLSRRRGTGPRSWNGAPTSLPWTCLTAPPTSRPTSSLPLRQRPRPGVSCRS